MQHLDPALLQSAILLLPLLATGVAFLIKRPDYFQRVGLMLGVLFNIPYLFLLNILGEHMGWWVYQASPNAWYNIPVEIVLGWAIFWGAFLPYVFRRSAIFIPVGMAAVLDAWLMPEMTGLFILGKNWLVGELLLLLSVLLPSLVIFRLTSTRKHVLTRGILQSVIWGGWIVFLIPAVVLQVDGKSIFDIFDMQITRIAFFLIAMAVSMLIGYMALYEFATVGMGTPIPFDPPQKLVTSGIYSIIANPLQVSTVMMFICIMVTFKCILLLLPIVVLILYSEFFVRWHHSIDIEKRFGFNWIEYRGEVRNWFPAVKMSW